MKRRKEMLKQIFFIGLLLLSTKSFAHEGHDIAPGALKANHGGTVKSGKEFNLELLVSGSEIKLYPLSHEGKDLAADEIKLTATTNLPKGKPVPAKVDYKEGAFVTMVDFKGAYRVELSVNAVNKGKAETFKFQIEK
jgi:hypothetical protein